MARFIPFVLCFVVGLVVGLLLTYRRRDSGPPTDWEKKYRDLEQRYRELTRKLGHPKPW